MKKLGLITAAFLMMGLLFGTQAMAQHIELGVAKSAQTCAKVTDEGFKASFSFSSIDATEIATEKGAFSNITMEGTYPSGNVGDPILPAVNKLLAIPYGVSNISVEVKNYTTTVYSLADYGIKTLCPQQLPLRKDQQPGDLPFSYNERTYNAVGYANRPIAEVKIQGTMRGIQVGALTINPVQYDASSNSIRVYNDIEVEVSYGSYDKSASYNEFARTFSVYFANIYKEMFNWRDDVYTQHPDLWQSPVKMLVIANRMFEDCLQDWLAWKTLKGFYVDVNYTDEIGTTASAIKTFIQNKYASDAPTFLMIMGDKDQIPASATGSETSCVTDLQYSSVDGDEFPDMYHSRFPAETVAQMQAMINKALEYEQYTMPDPSYLNNVLLIAGQDSGWGITVGRPAIWYATNYYYNTDHGFANVYEYTTSDYTGCYNHLNTGVGFANYTAHGSNTSWAGPSFTVSDVNNLTNEHKYFLAMGNCCQAADWGISGTCFGEAMVRAENKAAYAYIGSCPSTYWLNDYYFAVGATSRADGTMPSYDETTMGWYDAAWTDDAYNTVTSLMFIGNLASNAAQALGYDIHIGTLYDWQAYHTLGDGSIMPFRVQPTANTVSHMAIFPIGMPTYEVSAAPGSYVAISKDGVLHGVGLVGATGVISVDVDPVTSSGDVTICVTHPQHIPYISTVSAAALEGPYVSIDSYTPANAHVGAESALSITFKNVGTSATNGTTNVTLSCDDDNLTILNGTASFGNLASEATTQVGGFRYSIAEGVADGTHFTINISAVCGSNTWEGRAVITADEAVLQFDGMTYPGGFVPGETLTLTAKFKNVGHYQASNAVATMSSSSSYLTINTSSVNVGAIAVDQEVTCQFDVTVAANCPETAQIPVTFTMTANGGLVAQGNETLRNSCNVVFDLADSYGDGWNGASLLVSFDDGTASQSLTVSSGSSASYTIEIGNGTHVTLTWSSGSYDRECSFTVSYEGDLLIYQSSGTPSSGVICQFDCNCSAVSQTFNVNVSSDNTNYGTVSGGGEFNYGESCTVVATPVEGYMFTGWTQNGEVVSSLSSYSFIVISDMNLVAHFAEGVMVGDGGTSTNSYLPSYNYYKYSLSQQIFTVEELGSAGSITSIAFYNGGAEKTRTFDFYLKSTSKSTFSSTSDWVTVTASDKVFSGTVTMVADAWTIITLNTPFDYDGISNVVLVTDDNTGSYTNSPHMACRVFNANGTQALYKYNDGTNYDPYNPSGITGTLLSVKNQIIITKDNLGDCLMPTNLSATEVGIDYVKLSWTERGASEQWFVVCGDRTVEADTNEDFILNGLNPETEYTISVYPACDENMISAPITITTLEACPVPQNVEVSNNMGRSVTVTWGDTNESYIVQLGIPAFLIRETFDNVVPADWTNDATYPWTIVDGCIQSGNAGVNSSTSSISATVTYPADGTISFDFWSRGEGSDSNNWDKCRFYIDNQTMFDYGSHADWESYSTTVSAGTHTFTWTYKKDSSVNPTGDCFIVDNVEMKSGETVWNDPFAVEDAEYTFVGLTPETVYCVRVKGVCDDTETEWSETVVFTTAESSDVTQTVALTQGLNWWSTNLDITLDQLKEAVAAAMGTSGSASIKSQTSSIAYANGRWRGNIDFDIRKMYMIQVSADCEITLTGVLVNPAEYEITIRQGNNWIGFLSGESMSVTEAFSGLNPANGDVVKSNTGAATYNGTIWRGALQTLVPGHGYIYQSTATEDETFTY